MKTEEQPRIARQLARAGAWLFAAGIATGFWAAIVLTAKVSVPIPRLALAAHLNGLLGGLWLIAVAWTCPFLRYGDRGLRRLAALAALAAWANWLVTLIASALGVRGLEFTRDSVNNVIAVLLDALVVVPAFTAAVAWAWGFGGRRER